MFCWICPAWPLECGDLRLRVSDQCSPHLLVIQSSLHWRTILHLLGQPAIPGTGQMLLLHGGSNAYCCRLLVLQHVSEALEAGEKEGGNKRRGQGIHRGGGSRVPHQVISHIIVGHRLTFWWLFCHVGLQACWHLLSVLSNDTPEWFILLYSTCSHK